MKYIGKLSICFFITLIISSYEVNFNDFISFLREKKFAIDDNNISAFKYVVINIISLVFCDLFVFIYSKLERVKFYINQIKVCLLSKFIYKNHNKSIDNHEEKYKKLLERYNTFRSEFKVIFNHFLTILERNRVKISSEDLLSHLNRVSTHIDDADFNILKERCDSFTSFSKDEVISAQKEKKNSFKKRLKNDNTKLPRRDRH